MKPILEIVDDLYELRAVYGAMEADYRQGQIDVVIEILEDLEDEREEFEEMGLWQNAVDLVEMEYDIARLGDN